MFNDKFNKQVGLLTPEAVCLLENFSWPGNIRQLRHTIERVVALQPDGPIGKPQLDYLKLDNKDSAQICENAVDSYEQERTQFERSYLQRLLNAANGNVSKAARISGIARQNIYERMKRWELSFNHDSYTRYNISVLPFKTGFRSFLYYFIKMAQFVLNLLNT